MNKKYLFTPGPTTVPPECLLAMAQPIIHHRTSEYREIFTEVRENLKYVFKTEDEVLTFTSSGTGAMEATVVNFLSGGDKVLVVRGGKFGERFAEIAAAYGVEVTAIDVEWGKAVNPEVIKSHLGNDVKAVYTTLCETSTGVANDIQKIAEVVSASTAVLVVDAISGLGAMELETDKWRVDVVVSGSQKGLMIPPGLSFVSVGKKAWELVEKSDLPKYYFDFKKAEKAQEQSDSAFTPAISLIIGLRESLRMLKREGIENVISRHGRLAEATREAMKSLGLELFAESPADAVTAVKVPAGMDGVGFVKHLRGKGVSIAGGQAHLKGKIFRLAHLGYVDMFDILQMISAVEVGLNEVGYEVEFGKGVSAAEVVFYQGECAMKILVADSLSEEGVEILRKESGIDVDVKTKLAPEELARIIPQYSGLVVRSGTKVTKDIIEVADNLKVIGRAGVGLDNVDIESATERGIIVMNTPGGNTISTAEHTMTMMLALSRNVPQAFLSLKEGKWERKKFMGVEVFNKTLGIVGLGRIGGEVAKRALAFGMRVVGYDPYIRSESAMRAGVELVEIRDLLSRSDYITVHVPFTDETRHLIGKKEFQMMKEGVRIINCARGGIIDESALYEAIKNGKVAGAAFDVFEKEPPVDNPLLEFDSVVASPHLGASTEEAQVGVAVDIAGQIIDFLKKGIVRNAVNLPFVEPETFEELKPYCRLAEKLGSLESQLVEGRMKEVRIDCTGEDLVGNVATITPAVLKGVFDPVLKENVNYVNAPVIAKKRGVKVVESKSSQAEDYTSLIRVELETDKSEISADGVLFGRNDARVVRINSYHVDAIPEGHMLVCSHEDEPGIVGQIGVILGKANINIAAMTLGRRERGGREMTVLNVDSPVPADVLEEIKKSEHISDVKQVRL